MSGVWSIMDATGRLVDLTQPLGPDTPTFPGDPAVTLSPVRVHETDGYQVTQVCFGSHSGTHLDAPRHFFPTGATLDSYPLDKLVGPAVVVDVRPSGSSTTDLAQVDAGLLADRLASSAHCPGGFLLLWTEGSFLTREAAGVLLGAQPRLVGTDGSSLDPPQRGSSESFFEAEPYAVHKLLLGNGVLLAENLCNLHLLGPNPVTCAFLPLSLVGTDGAPVRAVAWQHL